MTNKIQDEEILEKSENITEETDKKNIEQKSEQELQIEKLEKENTELNDKLLRTTADIQNMKRRAIEDRVSARFDGAKDLLLPITKTIDDLNRAFAHIPEELQDNEFIKSLQAIEENLNKNLADQGVEFFGENSEKFDANLHDSMMMDPNTEKDTLAQVFEKGILFKNKVVRHAKVSVGNK
jgi:molecular chaperone GrpE